MPPAGVFDGLEDVNTCLSGELRHVRRGVSPGYLGHGLTLPSRSSVVFIGARNHRRGKRRDHSQRLISLSHGLVMKSYRDVDDGPRLEDRRSLGRDQFTPAGDDVDHFLLGGMDVSLGCRTRWELGEADGDVEGAVDLGAYVVEPVSAG